MEHPANTLISEGFACLENVRLLNIYSKNIVSSIQSGTRGAIFA